jgi:peroxiredoxin
MTQLGELRDAHERFTEAGIKLYAVSYDSPEALAAFADANDIPFPLLSDRDSRVIREYGILNTLVRPDEAPFYGIPFPGTYLVDEGGRIAEKFFPRHLANRESAETLLESALGELLMGENEPTARGGEDGVEITACFHGGGGVLKVGGMRRILVRFELPDGLHIYSSPVPEGMIDTQVEIVAPEGLVVSDMIAPPTEPLAIEGIDFDFQVWSGTVDLQVPVFANSHLVDVSKGPDGAKSVRIEVRVNYQACTDTACLVPRNETFELEIPLEPLDMPNLPGMGKKSRRVTKMDSLAHFKDLLGRFK